MVLDVAEPRVVMSSLSGLPVVSRDSLPGIAKGPKSCLSRNSFRAGRDMGTIEVKWKVWGSFDVDETDLLIVSGGFDGNPSLPCSMKFWSTHGDGTTVAIRDNDGGREVLNVTKTLPATGLGRWSDPSGESGTEFSSTVDISSLPSSSSSIALIARSRVDASWGTEDAKLFNPPGTISPQSHLVNARTNQLWEMENAGSKVKGRKEWFSDPIIVEFTDGDASIVDVGKISLESFGPGTGGDDGDGQASSSSSSRDRGSPGSDPPLTTNFFAVTLTLTLTMVGFATIAVIWRKVEGGKGGRKGRDYEMVRREDFEGDFRDDYDDGV